jgi:hypothetical protein
MRKSVLARNLAGIRSREHGHHYVSSPKACGVTSGCKKTLKRLQNGRIGASHLLISGICTDRIDDIRAGALRL